MTMKSVPLSARTGVAAFAMLLAVCVAPVRAVTTLGPLATDYDIYVVSGAQANSNQNGIPYADTTFYPKGGMMISAARTDPLANAYGSSPRAMDTVFSFSTAKNSGNASNGLTNGIDVVSAFDAQYGAGNWAITSVGVQLSTNYAAAGTQPNNPDFNTIAPGYFTLNLLGSNPDLTTLTWNKLQSVLGAAGASPVGTFYWPATGDLLNQYVSYRLTPTAELANAIKSGKVTLLGLAADNGVGYLFNTNTKGTPPALMISADALAPSAGPVLTLSTLADQAVTNNAILNVSGAVTDGTGIRSLTINGTEVALSPDGGFSLAVTLASGANTITTVASDSAGHQATDTRKITLDQTAPVLTITQPADNSIAKAAAVEVTGSVDEPLAVVLSASVNNGQTTNAHMSGSNFDLTLNLVPGMNTIVITATDQAGNTTSAKRSIIADTAAPTLTVTVPAQDISTTQGSIGVSGTVSNAITSAAVVIEADGRSYAPALAADGSFSQTIALPTDKSYAIVVTATDQAGNSSTVRRNIIKTTTPYPTGDIDGDGRVGIGDALKALRIAVGLEIATAADLLRGDVAPMQNGLPAPDGVIDIADAVTILRKVVGLAKW